MSTKARDDQKATRSLVREQAVLKRKKRMEYEPLSKSEIDDIVNAAQKQLDEDIHGLINQLRTDLETISPRTSTASFVEDVKDMFQHQELVEMVEKKLEMYRQTVRKELH